MIGFGLCVPALRGVGSSTAPPPVPTFALSEDADGQILVSDVQADLSITIRAPADLAGTVTVPWPDYAQGAALLVAPAVAGTPEPGATLTAVPGLWLHQGAAPAPSWCWQMRPPGGDFADLPGPSAPDLAVTDAMAGQEIRVVEVLAAGGEAMSAPVAVANPEPVSPPDPPEEPPSVPDFALSEDTDGQLMIGAAEGTLTITIAEPAIYAGVHVVPLAEYGDGLAPVVAPVLEGVAETGGLLTARPGLWLYSGPVPEGGLQWQARIDGAATWTDLAGETGTSLALADGLAERMVRVVETMGAEAAASAALQVAGSVPVASLIDFAATAPRSTGGVTVTATDGGWTMVPAQDGGSPAVGGAMSWDIDTLGLTEGAEYVLDVRLRRGAPEIEGEKTLIRTGANNALTSSKDNLTSNALEGADDVTLSLPFTYDGTDTRIGIRTEGWDPIQVLTATAMSLTEQTT